MNYIRIERIAQTIADVVDRHDRDEDHKAWEKTQPRSAEDLILRRGKDAAPGGGGPSTTMW